MSNLLNDLYWLAGLFEGEGFISTASSGRVRTGIGMVDEDVVRRAQEIAGVGHVYARNSPLPSGKTMKYWCVQDMQSVRDLLCLLRPMLGERRQAQIDEALEYLDGWVDQRFKPIRHGTMTGYVRERDSGIKICDDCREAYRKYHRDRSRSRRMKRHTVQEPADS